MKMNKISKALCLSLLYISVFVLLVVIQFPEDGSFSFITGSISLNGEKNTDSGSLQSLEISSSGLCVSLSERYPMKLFLENGKEYNLLPVSFENLNDGFSIVFDSGSSLIITSTSDGLSYWDFVPGELLAEEFVEKAMLHYKLAKGAKLSDVSITDGVVLTSGKSNVVYSGIEPIEKNSGDLVIQSKYGHLVSVVSELEQENVGEKKQFLAYTIIDRDSWNNEIEIWRKKAWKGLSGANFNNTNATWVHAGHNVFDEEDFAAYEAEAMSQGLFDEASKLAELVRTLYTDDVTFLTVPYVGQTIKTMGKFEKQAIDNVSEIERLSATKSTDIFYRDDIVNFMFNHLPQPILTDVMNLARNTNFSKQTILQSVCIMENYIDAREYLDEGSNPFNVASSLAERVIAPAIQKIGGSFYLESSTGMCDVMLSLRAGIALIKMAEIYNKDVFLGMGQNLVLSILSLADENGTIPAVLSITRNKVEQSEERLFVGKLYPIIVDCPYYPRIISYHKEMGPGTWVYTCSPAFSFHSDTVDSAEFSAAFPVGYSHFVALYGIKQYKYIQLYNLNYNMDSRFELYKASGYFYKVSEGTMYVKMHHRSETESIKLLF